MNRRLTGMIVLAAVLIIAWFGVDRFFGAGQTSTWATDFGPMMIRIHEDGRVEAEYPDHDGRMHGRIDPGTGVISGEWYQPSSDRACATERDGTRYWGRVEWAFDDSDAFTGAWSYCDERPVPDWTWAGRQRTGVHPLESLAVAPEREDGLF